jgi:long-subunit acyl-CoA synthetase (AMP-forming)
MHICIGLLPVLAESLKSTFGAVILTSYGMTECMPISSPAQTYRLDPTGTSGLPVGPDIRIVDDDIKPVANGVKGNILVRGPPCFGGYENNGSANEESFFTIDGEEGSHML